MLTPRNPRGSWLDAATLVLLLAAILVLSEAVTASAQSPRPPGNFSSPRPPGAPGNFGPASNFGAAGGFGPRGARPGPQRPKPAPAPGGEVQFEAIDPVTLPPGYTPPVAPPELMSLSKPIATEEEIKKLAKDQSKYKTALNKGEFRDDATKQLIRNGIRYQLARMTLPENRRELPKIRDELMLRQLDGAGKLLDKADSVREFRRFVMGEAAKQIAELLDNNYFVRLQAALMLGELNLTEQIDRLNLPMEPYTASTDYLVPVLEDESQPEAVKIIALHGLIRLFRYGQPTVNQKQAYGKTIEPALRSGKGSAWYQMRLAHALSYLDQELDLNQQPFLVNTLTKVLLDPNRDLLVRSEAARSLGRVPLAPSVDAQNLAKPIAAACLDLARASTQKPTDRKWKTVAVHLYLGFQAENAKELDASRRNKAGLLNNPATAPGARTVYEQVLPVLAPLIAGQKITQDQIQSLEGWVQQNVKLNVVADAAR